MTRFLTFFALAALSLPACAQVPQRPAFEWQNPHAKVLPQGELAPAPLAFQFQAGPSVRYIDFQNGNDSNAGTSKTTPWKHHPWDANATGNAKSTRGAHTYVFRRGVVYRGALRPGDDRGEPNNPIRLTSDPSWGTGEAAIYGSQTLSGWRKGAHPRMPESDKVWMLETDFAPRTLWLTQGEKITRLNLARMQNWRESDANDPLAEWPTWENPEWWKDNLKFHRTTVNGVQKHLGIDRKNLTGKAEDYVGATVWSEWGIVMGSPYPAKVEAFDENQRAVAFRGPWTFENLESIMAGNRYYLEDKPQWLDEGGEFWVEKVGNGSRIYLRLPDDSDPNRATIEAGRHINIVDATQLHHVEFSGLTFKFSGVHWDFNDPSWAHPDIQAGVLRLRGNGDDIRIRNCRFEHVNLPIRFRANDGQTLGRVSVTDNEMRFTDHGGAYIQSGLPLSNAPQYAKNTEFLRNQLHHIGWRIVSGEHGHAVDIQFPQTSHVAGNFLHRIAGWGISVTGGKPSGQTQVEAPFSRHLIHHNRVEDVLLKSNDWGGIETWQGGPFYIWNNLVINPVAFKNWTFRAGEPDNVGSFGHAYYLDGSFKNYLFNNIARGRNNTLGTKGVNAAGLQNIISFENTFFHNTFSKFAETTRQQQPEAGRLRYFSNIMEDSSRYVLRQADPKDGAAPDPNASHYTQGGKFAYDQLAFSRNVFHNIRGKFGTFEETGVTYKTLEEFRAAMQRVDPKAGDVGVMAQNQPLRAPERGDFRPSQNSAASGKGSKVWVPWGLSHTVGEWNFTRNNANPSQITDEHWNMTRLYNQRENFFKTPRYPLEGQNIGAGNFVSGALEDWTNGALQLNGRDQFLRVPHSKMVPPPPAPSEPKIVELDWARVTLPAKIIPDREFEVVIAPKAGFTGQPRVDLHWMKRDNWGGWLASSNEGTALDGGARRFTLKGGRPGELFQYSVLAFISPDGTFDKKTHSQAIAVDPGEAPIDASKLQTASIGTGDFLLELVVQTRAQNGTLVAKSDGQTGYVLDLQNGRPRMRLQSGGATFSAVADAVLGNGAWRHLLVDVDRKTGVTFYLDGRAVKAQTNGVLPVSSSLENGADFQVGGGPGQTPLAGSLDFLRVARSTLATSRTSAQELYAWSFNGPQMSDFAGNSRAQNNAAGALVR